MEIKLLRDARIKCNAGEVVEASPAEAYFLVSIGAAEPAASDAADNAAETPEKPKRTRKK